MATVIASVILGSVVLLDAVATVLLIRSSVPTPVQKTLQLVFIWIVPLVGSIAVIAILRETILTPRRHLGSGSSGNEGLLGIGPESESFRGHHGDHGGGGDVGHGDAGFGGH
jgi:uncharacterized membrane protein YgcG